MATPNQYASDLSQLTTVLPVSKIELDAIQIKPQASERPEDVDQAAQLLTNACMEARSWKAAAEKQNSEVLETKWDDADKSLRAACARLRSLKRITSDSARRLLESEALLHTALQEVQQELRPVEKLPQVDLRGTGYVPRAYAAGDSFLRALKYEVDKDALVTFLKGVQQDVPFQTPELWALKPMMLLALTERVSELAEQCDSSFQTSQNESAATSSKTGEVGMATLLTCLKELFELDWEQMFEQVSVTEEILREDPHGTYARMDPESRGLYRNVLADLADHSTKTEQEIARTAVEMARGPHAACSERAEERRSHVGYYLVGEGASALKEAVDYKAPIADRVKESILRHPSAFYFTGIGVLTVLVIALFIAIPGLRAFHWYELALLLLPALECAVATMNFITTSFVPPRKIPRMDFSEAIPADSTTMVVIPMLLGSEEQVKHAARDLEIRYLANRDAHLHFALLTDPPDSVQEFDEKDALAAVCSKLMDDLNEKYAADGKGLFYHFHRNRFYNASEGIWMGWERKRGKLLDLNNFLLGKNDKFAIRHGDLSLLPKVRYVITLDLDTQLPKDSARKLIGAMAHPLNRAVIDPVSNTVVEGYAILQPRVEISVKSKNRSRLAGIFSGDAGFDIYTRAISDVYQDLFGEGIFAGKGIYEVEAFQQVLDRRLPCNAVLSHDLIEGAYARVGLISDVEVIDDYPSHVSAYSRRKHRWVRGDWQIIYWLMTKVPDHSGKMVDNPISHVSQWKIVDNLRRSLTEFSLFLLLMTGWFMMPARALYWTLGTLAIILFPTLLQTAVSLLRAAKARCFAACWKNILVDFSNSLATLVFRLALLFHQSLVTMDAIVRTIVRMAVTRKRLLQWETAAESESLTRKQDPIELYLMWIPWLCFMLDLVVVVLRPTSIIIALPFLALWGSSKAICEWLNLPYWTTSTRLSGSDRDLLRGTALRTWRFFREFSNAEHNWLIPDIVQEGGLIANRISPTNLGFIFNSRLSAYDLGWSTVTEFLTDTENTFETMRKMPKHNGHLYNWYDTVTLQPVPPRFVSTVDDGNLVCCLWTLKQGCLEATREPIFRKAFWQGVCDHLEIVLEVLSQNRAGRNLVLMTEGLRLKVRSFGRGGTADWPNALPNLAADVAELQKQILTADVGGDAKWWVRELSTRITSLQEMVTNFAPWLAPQFEPYRRQLAAQSPFRVESLSLESLPQVQTVLEKRIQEILTSEATDQETRTAMELLRAALSSSADITRKTTDRLAALAATAEAAAKEIDFGFFYNPAKKQLSIGFDAEKNGLHEAHYDLLASEARAAVFVAIAKGEIPQAGWFQLGRPRKTYKKAGVLLSWTGTMFEYLLPSLWMKSYPNTLIEQSSKTAVHAQKDFATAKSVPWGISESSCSDRNPDTHYRYHAFGLPSLALSRPEGDDLVISPYSAFLALLVDAPSAAKNLREMKTKGWVGAYGYYDACDFTPSRMSNGRNHEMVRCWMAHHQGMILVAAATVLGEMSMQRRFHAEPMVAAAERILQEKVPRTPALELEPTESQAELPITPSNPPQQALMPAG
jgi:cyclic beta-1,2-glucan synthetase